MRELRATVGELEIISHSEKKVNLSYQIPEDGLLSIVIQDQLGRPHFEKDFKVPKTSSQLSFSLPDLSPGEYHAWISYGDQTVIRQMTILQTKSGFSVPRWMNLFT